MALIDIIDDRWNIVYLVLTICNVHFSFLSFIHSVNPCKRYDIID